MSNKGFFNNINNIAEKKILPFANKISRQRHLLSIRDSFLTVLPITLLGGIASILASPPVNPDSIQGSNIFFKFLIAWSNFAKAHSMALNWLFALTLGSFALYVSVGIAYYLSKSYKMEPFIPSITALASFLMVTAVPIELSFASKSILINFFDGKGLFTGMLVAITSVEIFRFLKNKKVGYIKMPDSVPPALSASFETLLPVIITISIYFFVYSIFDNTMGLPLPEAMLSIVAPAIKAVDNVFVVFLISAFTQFLWFFGIHDAAIGTVIGPIRDHNLAVNASAVMSGSQPPYIFTTPFWVYFIVIGGAGATFGLVLLLLRSKSKQLKTVGKLGILPALFGINEPVIFGTPLVLNPMFFIPFVFAQSINAVIAYLFMCFGIIGKTYIMGGWNLFSPIGAFISTMDWKAFVLVVCLIVLDILIYLPFFKAYEKKLVKMENEGQKS
ncbi:PTS sugar transporter subunit IIC [Maledivibacter halophilus]|uniref:Permease IIC component n=1 Tax=Maledivibacter halophilus TaxID=36842 RepID=A0A1T5JZX9_9FIRM|nr:PTS transporter subunit EIIC [Maledivibacter halophilus]SKC56946.1 PTS system, cellobiose-specific IIC component [Maledivibacter halophilus]